jgi:hypothetical protein
VVSRLIRSGCGKQTSYYFDDSGKHVQVVLDVDFDVLEGPKSAPPA